MVWMGCWGWDGLSRGGGVLGVVVGLGVDVGEADDHGGVVGGCGGAGLIGIVDGACGMDAGWSWRLGGCFWDALGDCAVADCGVGRDGVAVAVLVWLGCLVLVWLMHVMCCLTDVRMAVWYVVAVGLVVARRRRCSVCECGVGGGRGVWFWFGWDVEDGMG